MSFGQSNYDYRSYSEPQRQYSYNDSAGAYSEPMNLNSPQGRGYYSGPTEYQPPPISRPHRNIQRDYPNQWQNPHNNDVANLSPAQQRDQANKAYWPQVYRIYGTAMAILLGRMRRQFNEQAIVESKTRRDEWFSKEGLGSLMRWYDIMPALNQTRCRGKPKEVRSIIKSGVEPRKWPGNDDFSDTRKDWEAARIKALAIVNENDWQWWTG